MQLLDGHLQHDLRYKLPDYPASLPIILECEGYLSHTRQCAWSVISNKTNSVIYFRGYTSIWLDYYLLSH